MNKSIKVLNLLKPKPFSFKFFSIDNFKSREQAEEKVYVSQIERDTLKKLLKKVKSELEKDHVENEIKELKSVLTKFNIKPTDDLISDIRSWRDHHH